MLQPRIWASVHPNKTLLDPCFTLTTCLRNLTSLHLSISSMYPFIPSRHASHASEGRANKAAAGPGKRLGAKKTDSELVVPGNIIFRQRGTHWFPGENCGMGRDHTIFALEKGYVRYYKDPERHKERKYIGVVFDRAWKLPRGRGEARRRRLGMEAREMSTATDGQRMEEDLAEGLQTDNVNNMVVAKGTLMDVQNAKREKVPEAKTRLEISDGYMYREANWQIGRAAERAKVKVRVYKPGDRFLAWRKTNARKAKNAERRGLRRK